jgi:hypothetical protein
MDLTRDSHSWAGLGLIIPTMPGIGYLMVNS